MTVSLLPVIRFGRAQEPITTPKGFELSVEAGKKRSTVRVTGDSVAFSRPLSAHYRYWVPKSGDIRENLIPLWTHDYVGTHKGFYDKGYRWGVDLDKLIITKPNGKRGVDLPDGKYMIALMQDAGGKSRVVIGVQERGIDQTVLADFDRGVMPRERESLKVSNHTMLITRGKPVDENDMQSVATIFCGEVGIRDKRIDYVNDQSGQFFGPKGLTAPKGDTQSGGEATGDTRVMKNPDYDRIKSTALSHADAVLEEITGQDDIRMVKVEFVDENPTEEELRQPRAVEMKPKRADNVADYMKEPATQALFDSLDNDPESQTRLLAALGKNGKYRHAVQDVCNQLLKKATLKIEQTPKLAVELMTTPDAIGLFTPESPLYMSDLSDNTKRKVVAAYNKLAQDNPDADFSEFLQELKQYPTLLAFFTGRRMAGGFVKSALSDMNGMTDAIELFTDLVRAQNAPPSNARQTVKSDKQTPNVLFHLYNSGKQLDYLEKRLKNRDPGREPVILYNDPFELPVLAAKPKLARNFERLRKLEEKGVPIYRLTGTTPDGLVDYLSALYAMTGDPHTAQDAVKQQQVEAVLSSYNIDPDVMLGFAQDKFEGRWTNDLIVTALAESDAAFAKLLGDVTWFYGLPQKTLA